MSRDLPEPGWARRSRDGATSSMTRGSLSRPFCPSRRARGPWIAALIAALWFCTGMPGEAHAEWRRTTEIDWGTAYTIEEGSLSVGILSPLLVGVTDDLQVSVHPILLLVGKPSAALRYRLTPIGPVTLALNIGAAWSFIRRVDLEGRERASDDDTSTGFPGSVQASLSATFRLGDAWLLTAGGGGGIDFLGGTAERALIHLQLGAHYLINPRHMLMAQLSGLIDPRAGGRLVRPSLQTLYAWAPSSRVQVGAGLSFGRFFWDVEPGRTRTIHIFPVADVWFRF